MSSRGVRGRQIREILESMTVTDGTAVFEMPMITDPDVRSGSIIWVSVRCRPEIGSTDASLITSWGDKPQMPGRFVRSRESGADELETHDGGLLVLWRYD